MCPKVQSLGRDFTDTDALKLSAGAVVSIALESGEGCCRGEGGRSSEEGDEGLGGEHSGWTRGRERKSDFREGELELGQNCDSTRDEECRPIVLCIYTSLARMPMRVRGSSPSPDVDDHGLEFRRQAGFTRPDKFTH